MLTSSEGKSQGSLWSMAAESPLVSTGSQRSQVFSPSQTPSGAKSCCSRPGASSGQAHRPSWILQWTRSGPHFAPSGVLLGHTMAVLAWELPKGSDAAEGDSACGPSVSSAGVPSG
jgi:hypothetical protein